MQDATSLYERIYSCIQQIPPGRVSTYGTVGAIVGCPPRVVGYALHYLRTAACDNVPWQRVINARGGISTHGTLQRELLEAEGVQINADGCVDLLQYLWPDAPI